MVIMGFAALAGAGLVWALARCPLGRAIATSVDQFAAASERDRGDLLP